MNQFWRPNSVKNCLSESACGWAAGLRRLEGLQESEAHPVVMHRCKQDRFQHFTVIIFFCRPHERKVARSFDSGQLVSLFHHYVVFRTVESRASKKFDDPLQALAAGRYNEVEVQQLALETMKSDAWEAVKPVFFIVFPYKSTTQARCRIEIYRCYKKTCNLQNLWNCVEEQLNIFHSSGKQDEPRCFKMSESSCARPNREDFKLQLRQSKLGTRPWLNFDRVVDRIRPRLSAIPRFLNLRPDFRARVLEEAELAGFSFESETWRGR